MGFPFEVAPPALPVDDPRQRFGNRQAYMIHQRLRCGPRTAFPAVDR